MGKRKSFAAFLREEDGAVSVDWVVLTSGVVILGFAVTAYIIPSVLALIDEIAHMLGTHIHVGGPLYQ